MHGLSEENIAREEELFENMPVFPRISRSKNLTMLLVHRVKSCTPVPKGCDILAEGLYVDENYTYRYLDYRHVFTEKPNRSTLSIRLRFVNENTLRVTMAEGFCVPKTGMGRSYTASSAGTAIPLCPMRFVPWDSCLTETQRNNMPVRRHGPIPMRSFTDWGRILHLCQERADCSICGTPIPLG